MSRIVMAVKLAARIVPRRVVLGIYRVPAVARELRTFLNALVPMGCGR